MDCSRSLLPDNETAVTRAIEASMAQKYCNIDVAVIKKLENPWECPAGFLPWLALSQSVDVWNDIWPEETKRKVIANARFLHRNKGTEGGLRDALATIGVELEIVNWYEKQPEGDIGTIDIVLKINKNLNGNSPVMIESKIMQDIDQTIKRHKRLSVHYSFDTGLNFKTELAMANRAKLGAVVNLKMANTTINMTPKTRLFTANRLKMGAVINLKMVVH